MLRYALYCRKSDKDDGDTIKSIEDQRAYWTERAGQLGLVITKEYEENKSAMIPGARPVFDELLRDLKNGRVNAVLVWHISRIARNVQEGGAFGQLLVDGIVQEVRTPNACYTPADNILPMLLEQGFAVQQSRDLARTVRLSQQQMVKAGGWPHMAQIGYLNSRDPLNARRGIIEPDPVRFPLVRRGMEMMLTDQYSMREVVDAMTEWGLRTRPRDYRPAQPLAYSRGFAMFADPFYAGFIRYRGALYPGNHKRMISPQEYTRIQEIRRRRMQTRRRTHYFPYVGLIRCGLCGFQVTAERREKGGRTYTYYHCSDGRNRCSKRAITEIELEHAVMQALLNVRLDSELADVALANIQRWVGQGTALVSHTKAEQTNRLSAIERERKNLLDLLIDGTIQDRKLYQDKDAKLLEEQNSIRLALHRTSTDLEQVIRNSKSLLTYACMAANEFINAEPERKRRIAGALGCRYTLVDKELLIDIEPALAKIVGFAHKNTPSFEPGFSSSGSLQWSSFHTSIPFGGTEATVIEPDEELITLLRESSFPDLYSGFSGVVPIEGEMTR